MRRIAKRLLCPLLCAALLCGCSTLPSTEGPLPSKPSSDTSSTVSRPPKEVRTALAYSAADSLHPYKAQTSANRRLLPLLYEGLVEIDARWDAQPALASSWEQTDATHLTFTLREGAVFSDGTAVTASDVAASFQKARYHEAYRALTQNIYAVRAADSRTVTVTLNAADPHAVSALSFPVILERGDTCLGTGAYCAEGAALVANPQREAPAVARWELCDIPRESELAYALESGAIAYYFTELSDGEPLRSVGTVGQSAVVRNDLLFLGINSARSKFRDASVRAALSDALSREALCTQILAGGAVPATVPFVPTWSGAASLSGFAKTENIANAVAKWQELGYNKLDVELLTCADSPLHAAVAQGLKAQFGQAGVTVQTVSLPREEYLERIERGDFDIYLGEVRLSADLSLRPFFSGSASVGVSAEGKALYARYLRGELTAEAFCSAFCAEVPFLPLCWRQGVGVYATSLRGVSPIGTDVYGGIEAWTVG